MEKPSSFWATTIESIKPAIKIKKFINYVDDTASPMLRNRNATGKIIDSALLIRPQSPTEPPTEGDHSDPPRRLSSSLPSPTSSPFKSLEEKFSECLCEAVEVVDLEKLRKLAWCGIPSEFRSLSWKILMGYLPPNLDRHSVILTRKRREYREITMKYFGEDSDEDSLTLPALLNRARIRPSLDFNELILHQISIDIPRTCPESKLFQLPRVQGSLLRILYCWSIRRPATGYVQGINDLVTPFYSTFAVDEGHCESLSREALFEIEADTFWCLSNLLDTIQDSYTFNQSGIYRQVSLLREISLRMDPQLVKHLESEGVQFIQFSFRWMNCLLLREFRLATIQRLWDSYLAEGQEGFKSFHPYVCAAFLLKWRRELQVLDFQEIIVFLQRPPTHSWTEKDVELLLAEAFVLKSLFNK